MTLREKNIDYANKEAAYHSGTEYGQSGNAPTSEGLYFLQVASINSAINQGRQAALAFFKPAENQISYEEWLEIFKREKALSRSTGMDAFMDECFKIGFDSIQAGSH